MSDGTNRYNRLLGYILWITNINGEKEKVYFQRPTLMVCPISRKKYKITERNLKLYINELKESNPDIVSVEIHRISAIGLIRWSKEDDEEDQREGLGRG